MERFLKIGLKEKPTREKANKLESKRRTAADTHFENAEFENQTVTDHDGWTIDGNYWSKRVYGDNEDGSRFCSSYGVEFKKDSNKIIESWSEKIA